MHICVLHAPPTVTFKLRCYPLCVSKIGAMLFAILTTDDDVCGGCVVYGYAGYVGGGYAVDMRGWVFGAVALP